jgi:hypothetical protein
MDGPVQVRVWLVDRSPLLDAARAPATALPIDPRTIPLEHYQGTHWDGLDNIPVSYDFGERLVVIRGEVYKVRVDYGPSVTSEEREAAAQMVSPIGLTPPVPDAGG